MSTTWSPATHQHETTRERLAFTSITIDRAPGISPGFTIDDLSPDINIVFGPNASGKSTTARAIQALIWPHPSQLRGHHLAAEFDLGEEHWEIDADAARVTRTQDGQPAAAPVVAPIDDRTRYTLGLHDLLASENQPMAQAILKESSGGFDLESVAAAQGYRPDIPPRLESARSVENALVRLRDAERAEGEIVVQAQRLGELEEQERRIRSARADAVAFRQALDLAQARNDEEAARRHLASFPAELAQATGDEASRIAELDARIGQLQAQRESAARERDLAQADIAATRLNGLSINEGVIQSLRSRRDDLARLDQDVESLQRDVQSARAERESQQRRLAADLSDKQIATLDAAGIRELAELARAYEDIRVRRRTREEIERWIGQVTPPENVDTLRAGVEALSKRIQNPNREEAGALIGKARAAAYIGGLLVIASAFWLANFVAWPWILLAILGIVVIVFAWKYTLPASVREAAIQETRYRELGLPEPASWTIPAVRDRLNDLQDELRIALVEQEKADRWLALEQERKELDRAYAETESRRNAAVQRFGVAPDLKEESLRLLADNLGRWQIADTAVRGAEARLDQATGERTSLIEDLRAELGIYGYSDDRFDEQIDDLDGRLDTYRDAVSRRNARAEAIEGMIDPEIGRVARARTELYSRLGLKTGDREGLRERMAQLPSRKQAEQAVAERARIAREADDALALTPHLRDIDPGELRQHLADAESTSGNLDAVLQEMTAILVRIDDARQGHDIEQALGVRDDALNALRTDRDEISRAVAGQGLLEAIQHETRDAAMPIVFHRARELFSIITRGRYELQFEEGPPPAFTARDTSTGATLHLDQLSSGTRVQVLMAIRLAFVENVEVGPKLPVLLDETLGNSDELRAGAIIDAAIEIARKGRQVFYFTAQGDEVARWQARLDQMPPEDRPDAKIVDLAEIRTDAGFDRLPMSAAKPIRENRSVTTPDGMDRETYGAAIRAPGIDPWADGTGGIHLWHLIDDLPALHRLLEQDIQTWGQLTSIARASGIAGLRRAGVDEHLYERAEAKARLIETGIEIWRSGQGHPVTLRDIADAGLVDPVALEEVGELLDVAGADGAALVETLRASDDPPLSEQGIDRLEGWLIRGGFVSSGEPVVPDELRRALREAAADDIAREILTDTDVAQVLSSLPNKG